MTSIFKRYPLSFLIIVLWGCILPVEVHATDDSPSGDKCRQKPNVTSMTISTLEQPRRMSPHSLREKIYALPGKNELKQVIIFSFSTEEVSFLKIKQEGTGPHSSHSRGEEAPGDSHLDERHLTQWPRLDCYPSVESISEYLLQALAVRFGQTIRSDIAGLNLAKKYQETLQYLGGRQLTGEDYKRYIEAAEFLLSESARKTNLYTALLDTMLKRNFDVRACFTYDHQQRFLQLRLRKVSIDSLSPAAENMPELLSTFQKHIEIMLKNTIDTLIRKQ